MKELMKREIAMFRFGVIADLVDRNHLEYGELSRLLEEKAGRRYMIPNSESTSISKATILRWLKLYHEGGRSFESLYPRDRCDLGGCRSFDLDIQMALLRLRRTLPELGIRAFMREARTRGVIPVDSQASKSTVYRLLKRNGLAKAENRNPVDRRRFEAELPNDVWQADVMHGPRVLYEGKMRKTYLLAFLDDMSRFIPCAEFYLAENVDSFKDCFKQAVLKRGLPRKLLVDNGAMFRHRDTRYITAALGVILIYAAPYQPQSKGKIERWFRTIRSQFLPHCHKRISLNELNMVLEMYLDNEYHVRTHSTTGTSPLKRYAEHIHAIRSAPEDIDDYFRSMAVRRVRKDRTVSLDGRMYEAPTELIGRKVNLLFLNDDRDRIEVHYQGKSYGFLSSLDIHVNLHVRRERNNWEKKQTTQEQDEQSDRMEKPIIQGGRLFESTDEKGGQS